MNRKYRKTIIAGNWKMNITPSETASYASEIKALLPKDKNCDVVLCIPALDIPGAIKAFRGSKVNIGAQTVHYERSGAYTGEMSISMLKDLGVKYVIIGHSERREYFGETNFTVNLKVRSVLEAGITPIICFGESLQHRQLGVTKEFLAYQIMLALSGVPAKQVRKAVIAYEPLWAIGTGKTASCEEAQEVCQYIRGLIRKKYDARTARAISIIYGGSMNSENACELIAMPDVDGGLVGGASLRPEEFAKIVECCKVDG